ncbi:aldehyde oxygenase (deformylating) [Pantanalinema rosaneae CENA516]|uniref:aldehyde oxygenase (deformylating) n=1 Tax=Pantanalinema rosaneae TaxID=1620701 RepID=UPI003D6FF0DF
MTSSFTALPEIDFQSESYKDAYSRINAIAIVGEQLAFENFLQLAQLLPQYDKPLLQLAKVENRHKKSFQTCGKNLNVIPDLHFAWNFFAALHHNFQGAVDRGQVVTCLLIQSLIIECFAIAAYSTYLPVADDFARRITETVIQDEQAHLTFGETWLKRNFATSRSELKHANQANLPLIWEMLNQVEADVQTIGIDKAAIVETFMMHYGEALGNIGFSTREILQLSAHGLATPKNDPSEEIH